MTKQTSITRTLVSKSATVAFAAMPVVLPMIAPTRARASVLFSFSPDSTRVSSPSIFDYGNATTFNQLPPDQYSFTATQLANGGAHVSGATHPIAGSAVLQNSVGIHFNGDTFGVIHSNDVLNMKVDILVTVTHGNVAFEGIDGVFQSLNDGVYLPVSDTTLTSFTNGRFTKLFKSATVGSGYTTDGFASPGYWAVDLGLQWTNHGPNDTLTITIPNNSFDAWIAPVPEPLMATIMLLPAAIVLPRRLRRSTDA